MKILQLFCDQMNTWPAGFILVVRVSLLLLLAWIGHALLHRHNPRWRTAVWRAAAMAIFLLPVLFFSLPPLLMWRTESEPPGTAKSHPVPAPAARDSLVAGTSEPAARKTISSNAPVPYHAAVNSFSPRIPSWSWSQWLMGLWLGGALLMTVRLIYAKWKIHQFICAGVQAPLVLQNLWETILRDSPEPSAVRSCWLRLFPLPQVRMLPESVLSNFGLASPCVARWWRPVILIPHHLAREDSDISQQAILRHELSHVRNRDLFWSDIIHVAQAVLWFHPLCWRMAAAHQLACEEICDATAAEQMGDAEDYARNIARLALQIVQPRGLWAGLAMAESSELGRRLDRLESGPAAKRLKKWMLSGAAALVFGLIVIVATATVRGRNLWYERADLAGRNLKIKVGPNEFGLIYVARSQRDGSVRVEDGRAHPFDLAHAGVDASLSKSAAWLDSVEFKISPSPTYYDVEELRVFDSGNRTLVKDAAVQWTTNGSVLLRSLNPLPPAVDLWFRAQSYAEGDQVYELPCITNASVKIGGGTLTVVELHPRSYSSFTTDGAGHIKVLGVPMYPVTQSLCTFVWTGAWTGGMHQICAVSKVGDRFFRKIPYIMNYTLGTERYIDFSMPLANIDHFEIRPYGGRHTFFFPGIKLPESSSNFVAPPSLHVRVNGREVDERGELDGIPYRLQVFNGRSARSDMSSYSSSYLIFGSAPEETLDRETTVVYQWDSFKPGNVSLISRDAADKPLKLNLSASGGVSNESGAAGYQNLRTPLNQIGSLDIQLW